MTPLLASLDLAYPYGFWLGAVVLAGLIVEACVRIRRAWAIPGLLVYGTVGAWYLGDMIITGPTEFQMHFGTDLSNLALWQMVLFLATYRIGIEAMLSRREMPDALISVAPRFSQASLTRLMLALTAFWGVLFFVGTAITGWRIEAIIWPPVSDVKVGMFVRDGIGQGADFLLSTGAYIYIAVCAAFGMMAVLGRGATRALAGGLFLFTLPYFLFDRARSGMLAVLLPAVFCYLIGTWGQWYRKLIACAVMLVLISVWFGQVMHYRGDNGEYRVNSMLEFSHAEDDTRLLGLDMLGELCYMDAFVQAGIYQPNWGQRYFAEMVNVVPRTIWPGKPLVGYDYAYARGYRNETDGGPNAVYATISTGMIGQGVANFGRFFGVMSAALLMVGWTAILAKLWRQRFELPRFLLFLVGCGLTFNLGRDITLLVLWPFVFAYGLMRVLEKMDRRGFAGRKRGAVRRVRVTQAPGLPGTL